MATGFRLPFGRDSKEKSGTDMTGTADPAPTEVQVDAFADDCRIRGRITMRQARLLELLNGDEPLVLRDLHVEVLADGQVVELPELPVQREELLAVIADGPRGDPARRLHTRTADVEIEIGPYLVSGALHGTPASDPLVAVLRRQTYVPVTEAVVRYRADHGEVELSIPVLLVNRTLATAFRPIHEHHPTLADMPHDPAPPAGPDAPSSAAT